MWKSALELDKYQYVRTSPYVIRSIALLGAAATLLMGYGFIQYIQLKPLYVLVFGPIIFVFLVNKFSRFVLQMFYPRFDIQKHEGFIRQFWQTHAEPAVDVFLPWAGEDLEMHEEVVKGVALMKYKNLQVYMLDDKGSLEHQQLAEKYGFNYLSRPNKGEYKKSGNLEYGYAHSTGEFILILDADFIPTADSLYDLIPYLVEDKEIGILQTPQYFEQTSGVHSRSKIEFGGGNIVEDFYKVLMPCRDEFKAGMCVGTSAIYRREVITMLNGTPKVHASEDLATGLTITQFGYYVKYLPLIVSMGKSPDSFQGYFKQHQRWCSGNIVFARYWPRARLNLAARLIYLTNPFYYLSEALSVVFSYQFLVLLYFHHDSVSLLNTLYFLPYVIVSRILVPQAKTNKNKTGTRLAALNNTYTYFYTYLQMIFKGVPTWHPTGVKVQGMHQDYLNAFNVGTLISGVYIILFLFVLISRPQVFGNYNTYAVLGWSFYSLTWHVLFLTFVAQYIYLFRLNSLTSAREKVFAYARKNALLVLFCALIGSSCFSAVKGLSDPNAPTVMALQRLQNGDSAVANLALATPDSQRDVLGVSSVSDADFYTFTVSPDETLLDLIEKAIMRYQADTDSHLDEEQLLRAKEFVNSQMSDYLMPDPGGRVQFDAQLISRAVSLALIN